MLTYINKFNHECCCNRVSVFSVSVIKELSLEHGNMLVSFDVTTNFREHIYEINTDNNRNPFSVDYILQKRTIFNVNASIELGTWNENDIITIAYTEQRIHGRIPTKAMDAYDLISKMCMRYVNHSFVI